MMFNKTFFQFFTLNGWSWRVWFRNFERECWPRWPILILFWENWVWLGKFSNFWSFLNFEMLEKSLNNLVTRASILIHWIDPGNQFLHYSRDFSSKFIRKKLWKNSKKFDHPRISCKNPQNWFPGPFQLSLYNLHAPFLHLWWKHCYNIGIMLANVLQMLYFVWSWKWKICYK